VPVSAAERYRRILSVLLPAGALGMTILLGSAGAEAARELPAGAGPTLVPPFGIAERLSAVRDAVSGIVHVPVAEPDGSETLAWGNWANFGGPKWNNWNNKWKNWKNNWNNGWNNWPNGWKNWANF
jgi:hypothetical protein